MANDEVTITIVQVMPSFPGGEKALLQFLAFNVHYPQSAIENNIKGSVV